jgi:hypothetical protein
MPIPTVRELFYHSLRPSRLSEKHTAVRSARGLIGEQEHLWIPGGIFLRYAENKVNVCAFAVQHEEMMRGIEVRDPCFKPCKIRKSNNVSFRPNTTSG